MGLKKDLESNVSMVSQDIELWDSPMSYAQDAFGFRSHRVLLPI